MKEYLFVSRFKAPFRKLLFCKVDKALLHFISPNFSALWKRHAATTGNSFAVCHAEKEKHILIVIFCKWVDLFHLFYHLGPDYMSRAGPVSRAASNRAGPVVM